MQNRALLSEASLDAIEKAVAEAESCTSCEFIVVLAPESDRYRGRVHLALSVIGVLIFVIMYSVYRWALDAPIDALRLLAEALFGTAVAWVFFNKWGALKRAIIPLYRLEDAVETASSATFTQESVTMTKERNGCLIFASVLEGEVRIMPDIGLLKAVSEAKLGEIKSKLANAQSGDPTELICDTLKALGDCCTEKFPIEPDDVNELPDRPQIRLP
ncbi:MAG: hypothetical protein L3J82_02240 [Planctomycetes bacterium]|nr:hypothetical protein [Planctomycetota bacterium]